MQYFTSGESHGEKLVIIIDALPSGISFTEKDINFELKRRSAGPGRSSRQDSEFNTAKIVSGVDEGRTTGNPVCVEIMNNFESTVSDDLIPRPGHADLNGVIKHNFDSCKNVSERASARETAARIVAGVLAKNLLIEFGVEVYGYVSSIGSAVYDYDLTNSEDKFPSQSEIAMSDLMCPDEDISNEMKLQIERASDLGDSLGGSFNLIATGVVAGLGSYSQGYDRLDSKISACVMSVPSVKGVEIGSADFAHKNVGSASLDNIVKSEAFGITRSSNYSGGIEGGMTNGMPVFVHAKVKPVPSIKKAVKTINLESCEKISYNNERRFDVCVVPNACVVAENELAFVLANAYLEKFGSDCMGDIKSAYQSYNQRIKSMN